MRSVAIHNDVTKQTAAADATDAQDKHYHIADDVCLTSHCGKTYDMVATSEHQLQQFRYDNTGK